jgi:archaellum component FlaC
MKKKNITIDDLALMVQKGFEETAKKKDVDKKFKDMDERFDRIEKLILADHKRRIERLEQDVKELRNLLAVG